MIAVTGDPEDWTESSEVMVKVPGAVRCAVLLPDRRTIRYVWGTPPRAEDLDTRSGKRAPANLVPAAYEEGCPDLSRNGRRLVFQGRTPEGAPFAFVSEHSDGRDATPVVAIGDPTVDSQPLWLEDNESFVFDIDLKHVGIFSTTLHRTTVVPEPALPSYLSTWHWTGRGLVIVAAHNTNVQMEVSGYEPPSLTLAFRVRMDLFAINFSPVEQGRSLFTAYVDHTTNIAQLDYAQQRAQRLGFVRGHNVRRPFVVPGGIAFLSTLELRKMDVRDKDGRFRTVFESPVLLGGSRCGDGYLTLEGLGGNTLIVRRDEYGRQVDPKPLHAVVAPTCAADGHVWYYASKKPEPGIVECKGASCNRIVAGEFVMVAVSPSGKRLAFARTRNSGFALGWMWAEDRVVHELPLITGTFCTPTWSSESTLWVVQQRRNRYFWVELNVDSARETGQTLPAGGNCAGGDYESRSPFETRSRVTSTRMSEWRRLRRNVTSVDHWKGVTMR
jgi:hypothetical protein